MIRQVISKIWLMFFLKNEGQLKKNQWFFLTPHVHAVEIALLKHFEEAPEEGEVDVCKLEIEL